MPAIAVERTWLEMRQAPSAPPTAGPVGASVVRARPCPVAWYRFLYGEVGRAWSWLDRLRWTDEQLAVHLADPGIEVWVALDGGVPLGYFELRQDSADASVEIAYFGLLPWAIGQGVGRWLLEQAIATAWRLGPNRVWLHTCTLDHPAALPNYLKRGFRVTRVEQVTQEVP